LLPNVIVIGMARAARQVSQRSVHCRRFLTLVISASRQEVAETCARCRRPPMLEKQQAHSRRGIDALVYELADRGKLPCAHPQAITDGETTGNDSSYAVRIQRPKVSASWHRRSHQARAAERLRLHAMAQQRTARLTAAIGAARKFPLQPHWDTLDEWTMPHPFNIGVRR
jgi:hypothetical protein